MEIKTDQLGVIHYANGHYNFNDFWEALPLHRNHSKDVTYDPQTFETGWYRLVKGYFYNAKPNKRGAFQGTMIRTF